MKRTNEHLAESNSDASVSPQSLDKRGAVNFRSAAELESSVVGMILNGDTDTEILELIKGHKLNISATPFIRVGSIFYLIASHRRWRLLWELLVGDYLDTLRLGPLNQIYRDIARIDLVGLKNSFDKYYTSIMVKPDQHTLISMTDANHPFLVDACRHDNILAVFYFLQSPLGEVYSFAEIGVLASQYGAKSLIQFLLSIEPPHKYLYGKLFNVYQCITMAIRHNQNFVISLLKPIIRNADCLSSRLEKIYRDPTLIDVMSYLLECGARVRTHPKQSFISFYLFPTQPEEACDNNHAATLALMLNYCTVNEENLMRRAEQRGCDEVIKLLQDRELSRVSKASAQQEMRQSGQVEPRRV